MKSVQALEVSAPMTTTPSRISLFMTASSDDHDAFQGEALPSDLLIGHVRTMGRRVKG